MNGLNDRADKSAYPSYKRGTLTGKQMLLGVAVFIVTAAILVFVMGW